MTSAEWLMLALLAAVWGGSFVFNQIAVRELPVFTIVALRVTLAAAILLLVLRLRGERTPRSLGVWSAFLGMGLLNNALPFSLIVWGQQQISSGAAAILNASTPLFAVVFAHFLTSDERLNGGRIFGVLAGFAGVAAMIGPGALGTPGADLAAQICCLAGAASYALAGIFGRRFRRMGVSPMAAATGQLLAASLTLLPLALFVDRPWTLPAPSLEVLGALIGLAAISTALAYALYFRLLATAGATNLLLVTFLIPISAICLGALFLGERLEMRQVLGMGLIGIGLAAVDGRIWSRFKKAVGA